MKPIMELLGKSPDPATAAVLRCLCLAAFLRAVVQPYPQMFLVMGRPSRTLVEALLTALMIARWNSTRRALARSTPWRQN